MTAVEQAQRLLASMTPAEKAEFLQRLVWDLSDGHPGIDVDPKVCGGEARIVRTRVPVWVLEQSRRLGMSEAEILGSYPTLRAADLANAWAYVGSHRNEIDRQIADNEAA